MDLQNTIILLEQINLLERLNIANEDGVKPVAGMCQPKGTSDGSAFKISKRTRIITQAQYVFGEYMAF